MGRMAYAVGRASRGGWGLTGTAPHAMPRTRSRPERGRQGHPLREGWIRTGPEQADTAIHAGRLMPGNARRKPDAKRAGGRQGHPLRRGWPDTERVRSRQAAATHGGQFTAGGSYRATHAAGRTRSGPEAGGVTRSGEAGPIRNGSGAGRLRRLTPQAGRETGRGQAGSPAPGGWPDTERVRSRQPGSPRSGPDMKRPEGRRIRCPAPVGGTRRLGDRQPRKPAP